MAGMTGAASARLSLANDQTNKKLESLWRPIFVSAISGAIVGALSSWGVINRLQSDVQYQGSQIMEHRRLDGHGYVLRLLPRIESSSETHDRQIEILSNRVSTIESNRYTDTDGEKDRRLLEIRIEILRNRVSRLESQLNKLTNKSPPEFTP